MQLVYVIVAAIIERKANWREHVNYKIVLANRQKTKRYFKKTHLGYTVRLTENNTSTLLDQTRIAALSNEISPF